MTSDATFQPQIVNKCQRRLTGVDKIVLWVTAPRADHRGHLGAPRRGLRRVGEQGDGVQDYRNLVDEMTAWCNRPLDAVYPVMCIVAIVRREALRDRVEVRELHGLALAAAPAA